jgi:hypothetical protein
MLISIVDLVGWIGAVFVLCAYLGIISKRLKTNSLVYLFLNLFGAAGILVNAFYYRAYPSAILNVAWAIIALYGIVMAENFFGINHPHHTHKKRKRKM